MIDISSWFRRSSGSSTSMRGRKRAFATAREPYSTSVSFRIFRVHLSCVFVGFSGLLKFALSDPRRFLVPALVRTLKTPVGTTA